MDRLGRNLGGHIPSCAQHVRHDAVAVATAVAWQRRTEHSAVMGVWTPNAWTNFDEIWSHDCHCGHKLLWPQWQSCDQNNIKSWRTVVVESIRNAITCLQINRLGRNFGGRIPSCSQYWKYYNSSYDGTDWDDSWMVASKQHLCCKTVSLVFSRYC